MANSQQYMDAMLQSVVAAFRSIMSFVYIIVVRTGQYFGTLNAQMNGGQDGPTGMSIMAPFLPIVIILICVTVVSLLLSWFFRNFELDFG